MHCLARNFSLQLKEKVENEELEEFGVVLEYKKVYMGQTDDGEYVTVEEFIDGDFIKYINNDGFLCKKHHHLMSKAECYAHFTYQKSEGKLIVLDIQGSNQFLYDPEIASSDLLSDDGKILFCNGNYSKDE